MIKIFTLNLWRYYDFDIRLSNIINSIQDKNPDVIFLQETQIDEAKSPFSQVELIKNKLVEYKYSYHSTIYLKKIQRGVTLDKPIQEGMSVLSKYPIVNFFEYYLYTEPEKEPRSIMCFDMEINNKLFKFANIHFNNDEESAKSQLKDFLKFLTTRVEKRIMVGDFNLYGLPKYLVELGLDKDYNLSFDFKNYISYPEHGWCLDYILIPNEFKFLSVDTIEGNLSDHQGVFTVIDSHERYVG